MRKTCIRRRVNAPRAAVYRALVDAAAVAEKVVEVVEFETDDPALRGQMTITTTLSDADGGTDIVALHEGLPPRLSPADNEEGWRQALDRLAALVEASAREA